MEHQEVAVYLLDHPETLFAVPLVLPVAVMEAGLRPGLRAGLNPHRKLRKQIVAKRNAMG